MLTPLGYFVMTHLAEIGWAGVAFLVILFVIALYGCRDDLKELIAECRESGKRSTSLPTNTQLYAKAPNPYLHTANNKLDIPNCYYKRRCN